MGRLNALKELAAKVAAGTADHEAGALAFINDDPDDGDCVNRAIWAQQAYQGSLDAALALHNAVLPGWFWSRQGFVMQVTNDHTGWGNGIYGRARNDDNPARAWLLAVLRALIAQEEAA